MGLVYSPTLATQNSMRTDTALNAY